MLLKRELVVTQDSQRYHHITNLLREHKIPFTTRTTFSETRFTSYRKHHLLDRSNTNSKPFYYIFVSKKHFSNAIDLINQR